jgi:excisionase family DNA binding protein
MKQTVLISLQLDELQTVIIDCVNTCLKYNNEVNTSNTEPKEVFLSIEEAAKFLKLQVSTVRTKVSRKELPHMKPENSKGVIFSSLELAEYLKAGRRKTNAELEAEADAYMNKKRG